MKVVFWGVGVLLGLLVALFGLERIAAERVEVVELHTQDENGESLRRR